MKILLMAVWLIGLRAADVPDPQEHQHGHRVGGQVTYLIESGQPAIRVSASRSAIEAEFGKDAAILMDLRLGGTPVSPGSSVASVAFETWVEDAYSSYVEVMSPGTADIAREAGKLTVQRFVRDEMRQVYLRYAVTVEPLPETGTYRVTFADSTAEALSPNRSPTNLPVLAPPKYPVPQILHDGEAVRLDLYRDPRTGQRVVDYIEVGAYNRIEPRKEAPHDSYADDAEFNLTRPQVKINGEPRASGVLPETLRGAAVWVYLPGHGRYVLSFKSPAVMSADDIGEANGNSVTFADGANIFRIECAERIAPGSGAYRVHVTRDPAWAPGDARELGLAMIGVQPGL